MENNAVADFHGYAFTNSWHSVLFSTRLRESTSPEGHSWLAQDLKIKYFLAPSASSRSRRRMCIREISWMRSQNRWRPLAIWNCGSGLRQRLGCRGRLRLCAAGDIRRSDPVQPFFGRWSRDLQFTQAYEGTLVYTNDTRSRLLIRFRGRSIQLKYTAAANRCSGLVSIDEGEEKPVNEFSLETKWQTLSPEYDAGNPGEHLMQLRFPEGVSKIPIASCYLDLDGFIVR